MPDGTPNRNTLPTDAAARKAIPIASGVLDYFPAALAEIAKVSKAGNDQHNPGEPLHWARGKSMDQADTLIRHFMERGAIDSDGVRHSAKMVWRALALLQLELEAEGAPMARGARNAAVDIPAVATPCVECFQKVACPTHDAPHAPTEAECREFERMFDEIVEFVNSGDA